MKNVIRIILFSLLFSACEKTVDNVDIPQIDPKLVAQSFVSPHDDSIRLYLTWSSPIFGDINSGYYGFQDVKNADVYISDKNNKVKLSYVPFNDDNIYNDQNGYYSAPINQFNMQVGEKFDLDINEPKGNHITAETIIPDKPIYSLTMSKIDSITDEWSMYGYSYRYFFNFQGNNNNDTNYYSLIPMGYISNSGQGQGVDSINLYDGGNNTVYYKILRGKSISIIYHSYLPLDSLKLMILHTDKAYYNYHYSVNNFDGGDNPFSEPVIVYSNIKNGLGIFCSYDSDTEVFVIKP